MEELSLDIMDQLITIIYIRLDLTYSLNYIDIFLYFYVFNSLLKI